MVPAAPMSETSSDTNPISDVYQQATRINAKLASGYDGNLVSQGKRLADELIAHVRGQVDDYDDFVRRVERSEQFSLHESAQVAKGEKELKVLYVRAADLLETIRDVEARKSSKR